MSRNAATATLWLAFGADPVLRWVYPTTEAYVTHFPATVEALGGRAFERGAADIVRGAGSTSDGYSGVALWLPPGVMSDEKELGALLEQSIEPPRQEALWAFLGEVAEHHPTTAHWYLPLLGVEPTQQGHGLGSELLRRRLAECDRDGIPAYLEASRRENRRLYERHGFRITREIQMADSPPLWPMWRVPGQ